MRRSRHSAASRRTSSGWAAKRAWRLADVARIAKLWVAHVSRSCTRHAAVATVAVGGVYREAGVVGIGAEVADGLGERKIHFFTGTVYGYSCTIALRTPRIVCYLCHSLQDSYIQHYKPTFIPRRRLAAQPLAASQVSN
jgi:hypothetical protein